MKQFFLEGERPTLTLSDAEKTIWENVFKNEPSKVSSSVSFTRYILEYIVPYVSHTLLCNKYLLVDTKKSFHSI